MFERVLVANRGEIAVRVIRTCRELGIRSVAVHSDADAGALHVRLADEAVRLPGVAPGETYLDVEAVVEAARQRGCEAVHPGYGFLSERADAAEAIRAASLVWVGPSPDALRAAGDKLEARRLATDAGVTPVPGTLEPAVSPADVDAFGGRFGYPVAIKAVAGGGGRGLRVAAGADDAPAAFEAASREALAAFGIGEVYLERYLTRPKHVEVQILSEAPGAAMWLGARECSLQRRHQKLIEETPPARPQDLSPGIGDAAVAVANACGYVNAGTVEFLVDADTGAFYFLEVNARLQVEHCVTEAVLGLDLVAAQLRIAAGEPLGFGQDDLRPGGRLAPRGHAIECRINAEDPARGFVPTPGLIERYHEPGGPGVRVDSGFAEGDRIPDAYDSLIAKLVVWGATREEARRRAIRALEEYEIEGVATTIPAHLRLLAHPEVVDGSYTTQTVEGGALDGLAQTAAGPPGPTLLVGGRSARLWHPAMAGSIRAEGGDAGRGASGRVVLAPMHGTILRLLVQEGDRVARGEAVAILEAMKMETHVSASAAGTVREVRVGPGSVVEAGEVVATIGAAGEEGERP
jgi:acetyl-CoA/propionyl-CoA carboxylase biotin carboxyl carrier protein